LSQLAYYFGMNRCRNPDHPHCTVWVMPGDAACAHGHPQPSQADPSATPEPEASVGIQTGGATMAASARLKPVCAQPVRPQPVCPQPVRPQLHVSGFDPRAAGGRQAIRLTLRGMPGAIAPKLGMQLKSALFPFGSERLSFTRTAHGDWLPLFVEFSSRALEHGQYRIEVALHSADDAKAWTCTLVILVPRSDATLTEIHNTFLSTHKNVRVVADDASIARVKAHGVGALDIDVRARNASIAHLDLDGQAGKVDLGLATIAWDEELIEIDPGELPGPHPWPADAACLVDARPSPGAPVHARLFAADEHVLGRFDLFEPAASVLLAHAGASGLDSGGLTRRLSARHAIVRRGRDGFEIEDVSRYGVLIDGVWPGKNKPVALRTGMRIELTASIKGIVVLAVTALLPNGVILHRVDAGSGVECFWLLEAERDVGCPGTPTDAGVPRLFHRDGGFWHMDPALAHATALTPAAALGRLGGLGATVRFAGCAYPDMWTERSTTQDRRRDRRGTQAFGV
jgi:hypothetical protein